MKFLRNLFLVALSTFMFNACEDVPAPYPIPGGGVDEGGTEFGENLLPNNDLETWKNGKPQNWCLGVTNCEVEQSSDAYSGTSAVLIKGNSNGNKRFASKSYFLQPGTYQIGAFLKQSGETAGKYNIGYAKLTNGSVADTENDYVYLISAASVSNEWEEVTAEFTVNEETEVSLIIMNNKRGEGASILVDDITFKTIDGGIIESEAPSIDPEAITEISTVINAGACDAKISGTIIATYSRGFLVKDATATILVYLGENEDYVVGDVVTVSGTTSMYAGMLQFGNSSTVEKTGTETVSESEPTVWNGSDMDNYLSTPTIEFVQYTGRLNINGYYYNVNIDDASKATGSIAYPHDGMIDENLNGKKIVVTGYTIGVNQNKYLNTMAVSVVAAEGEEDGGDVEEPTTPGEDDKDDDSATTETVTFDFSNPVALTPSVTPGKVEAGATQGVGVEFDDVTFTNSNVNINLNQGSSSTPVRIWTKTGGDVELRTYKNSTITISKSDGSEIKEIVFEGGKKSTMTAKTGTFSSGTWNGSANSVTFSVTGTLNITSIAVK